MERHIAWPFLMSIVLISGCEVAPSATLGQEEEGGENLTSPIITDPAMLLSDAQILEDYSNVSCESMRHLVDYLDQIGSTDYFRGLSGDVYYQPQTCREDQGVWDNLDDYYQGDAIKIDTKLYLSKLDVPTRKFDLGFPKLGGGIIQNTEGEDLVEYFSIDFKTGLKLGDEDEEGEYEFAILSDDGVEMSVGDNEEVILSHTNKTPTRMVCATQVVTLRRGETLPSRIRYFQGPRRHIAISLMWRKVTDETGNESLCGTSGNSKFFDYDQSPSEPKQPYLDLLDRGWSVVPAHVFRIPRGEYMNPCESDHVVDVINGAEV